jgi:hypothetical protein
MVPPADHGPVATTTTVLAVPQKYTPRQDLPYNINPPHLTRFATDPYCPPSYLWATPYGPTPGNRQLSLDEQSFPQQIPATHGGQSPLNSHAADPWPSQVYPTPYPYPPDTPAAFESNSGSAPREMAYFEQYMYCGGGHRHRNPLQPEHTRQDKLLLQPHLATNTIFNTAAHFMVQFAS